MAEVCRQDGCGLLQRTGRNSMSGIPGAGPRAGTGAADRQKGAESACALLHNQDLLGPRTLRHPQNCRGRQSGKLDLGLERKHSDGVAVHLGLE